MISVVIAEDQGMVLGAIAALLTTEYDITVVARARDGTQAVALTREHRPHILLTDIEMPAMTGLEVALEVKRLKLPTRVIIVTTFARPGYLRRALEAGVSGYLLKDSEPESLAGAVRRVHAGLRVIDPELAAESRGAEDPLTDRERRVLRAAGTGRTSAEISHVLNLSEGTVRNYLSDAMAKLNASTRMEAVQVARDMGWL